LKLKKILKAVMNRNAKHGHIIETQKVKKFDYFMAINDHFINKFVLVNKIVKTSR